MKTYSLQFAADVRAYGCVDVKANSEAEAQSIANDMLERTWQHKDFPAFDTDYETLDNFELLYITPTECAPKKARYAEPKLIKHGQLPTQSPCAAVPKR